MSPIQTGLIGYGLAGSVFHAPLLLAEPCLRLAAIATSRAGQVRSDVPSARACEVDALLDDPAIELVVVATPNDSHVPLAARALRAGKHVVVDKPLAVRSAEAQQLIDLASRHGRLLSVFQNRRWDAGFLALRRAIEEDRLGDIASYEARFDRFRPQPKTGWRERDEPGAGVLYDLGAHLIDQALALFGLPELVDADVAVQRAQARVPDWFQLRLHYGRRRVLLGASTLMARPGPQLAVHGERGSFLQFGLDGQEAALKSGLRPGQPGWGALAAGGTLRLYDADGAEHVLDDARGAYEQYYRGIAASLRDGAPPPVRAEDARDTLRVIEAAMRSSAERRSVAVLP
ncbi:oxidoreductase [Frateuria sp. Soil773]|uniref:oxidoreductase n=1 Tax=Frateuria sp. Soil773 TaxID=1736407 RepID=UPI0006F37DC1|nr:oxidoreductase [Frateuria sp. Soil773]KRF01946.1 oxidoreductase [Frateuria sp. Soil773]